MGVTLAVAAGVVALAVAGVLLVRRATARRRLRALVSVVVVLAVVAGGVLVWARLMLDESGVARALVWMESDTGDWRRFDSRPVPAGDHTLELREAPDGAILSSDVDGRSLEELLQETGSTAFIVLRGDDVLVEQYLNGSSATATQTSFSVAKSFLSTLLGIAIDRGEIGSLDDPVTDYVPELADRDERFEQITLRHLVSMSSGLRYEEQGLPWSDDATTYYAPDLRAVALSAEVAGPPGERFHYNNYNPLLTGLVLERATGMSVAEYMSEVLWQPMGAGADGSWSIDSTESGFEKMESGVNARAMDFAGFGYLAAHEGVVDGRQVVSAAWLQEATAEDLTTDPAAQYQYGWWIDVERDGRFYAHGNHGQFVYVDPATDVVVVRLGSGYGIEPDAWVEVLRTVADDVGGSAGR
ncbi:CubicO group peptidase (beta-lactamase class C family) [Georgenia soli]|uniref:CubicO group peptidase (Beta-lactamase class C family) n=1 Tax=Georgenia soli TaxID=638953 RepID=A0A2A9ES39_9MICO|nr:serine hydrolase [Georgenia soli]PFG41019.1 CubicO group peptidase (beta-lactamase class C family) [Georgenia soli]